MYRGAEQQLIFTEMALYPVRASECQQTTDKDENGQNSSNSNPSQDYSEGVKMQLSYRVLDFSKEAKVTDIAAMQ